MSTLGIILLLFVGAWAFTAIAATVILLTDKTGGSGLIGVAVIGYGWPFVFFILWPYLHLKEAIKEAREASKEKADGKVLTDPEFHALLKDAVDSGRVTKKELRRQFGVSVPTLDRWLSGESAPHPFGRRPIIDYVHGRRSGPIRD